MMRSQEKRLRIRRGKRAVSRSLQGCGSEVWQGCPDEINPSYCSLQPRMDFSGWIKQLRSVSLAVNMETRFRLEMDVAGNRQIVSRI